VSAILTKWDYDKWWIWRTYEGDWWVSPPYDGTTQHFPTWREAMDYVIQAAKL
jgi:hypothetical protein